MRTASSDQQDGWQNRHKRRQSSPEKIKVRTQNQFNTNHQQSGRKTLSLYLQNLIDIFYNFILLFCLLIRDIYHLSQIGTPYILTPLDLIERIDANMGIFTISSTFQPAKDIPDLSGKVVLVTGGNTGLGKETILQLAAHKPQKIYLCSRSVEKGRAAIESINSQLPSPANIHHLQIDTTSFPTIKTAVNQFLAENDRLDLLYLNAGIMAVPEVQTETGHEIQIATNHIGHFLLTKLLLPTLEKTASQADSDVRILSISSEAWNMSPPVDVMTSTEKLTKLGAWKRYGASKAANVAFAAELARRYPQFTSVSLHPGMIKTELYSPSKTNSFLFRNVMTYMGNMTLQDVPHGALNQLYLGSGAKKADIVNGSYYTPVGKQKSNKWTTDVAAAKQLWDWTEKELEEAGY